MSSTRGTLLTRLKRYYNIETGTKRSKSFKLLDDYYTKSAKKKQLDFNITNCQRCEGMNIKLHTEAIPGYGNIMSNIMLVGQSPGGPCMNTMIPFSGGCGYLFDAALFIINMHRRDIFITNVIHCHPENNRPSTKIEKKNCKQYLKDEIKLVQPELIVAMGRDAKDYLPKVVKRLRHKPKIHPVTHPAAIIRSGGENTINWIIKLAQVLEKYK